MTRALAALACEAAAMGTTVVNERDRTGRLRSLGSWTSDTHDHGGRRDTDACGSLSRLHRFVSRIGFTQARARPIDWDQRTNRDSGGAPRGPPRLLGLERIETAPVLRQPDVF